MEFHGRCISFEKINEISRKQFLDPQLIKEDEITISRGAPLHFLPNDIQEVYCEEDYGERQYSYHMVMHGITPSGLKCMLAVKSTMYALIRVPDELIGLDVLEKEVPKAAICKISQFKAEMLRLMRTHSKMKGKEQVPSPIKYHAVAPCRYYQSDGYQVQKGFYYKVEFYTKWDREAFLSKFSIDKNRSRQHTTPILGHYCNTAHDDASKYYNVICRDMMISLCTWNVITKYSTLPVNSQKYGAYSGDLIIECDLHAISKLEDPAILKLPHYRSDYSMVANWDIECMRWENDGSIPDPLVAKDEVFMVCITYGPYHCDSKLRLCITSRACIVDENDLTIQCKDERQLCHAFARVIGRLQPEFIVGFNDGNFDWAYMVEKAWRYNMLEDYKRLMSILYKPSRLNQYDMERLTKKLGKEPTQTHIEAEIALRMVGKHHRFKGSNPKDNKEPTGFEFKHETIKLDAETMTDVHMLKLPGWIPIDARSMYQIIYKNPEQSSLNFFLKDNKLDSKEDMPIVEMFQIYRDMEAAREANDAQEIRRLAADMCRIKVYCDRDADACLDLFRKRNVIMDRRALGELSYVSMYDTIFRADGMKVKNIVYAFAMKRGIVYSSIGRGRKGDKYPGAHVVPPQKGMQCSKLSIKERVAASVKYPYFSNEVDYSDWKLTDPEVEALEEALPKIMTDVNATTLDPFSAQGREILSESVDVLRESCAKHVKNFDHRKLLELFMLERTGRPTSGIDFASLYPSLMMAYNLSKETIIALDYRDPNGRAAFNAKVRKIRALGLKLHHISFPYGEGDQSITVEGYSVRHNYDVGSDADPAESGFGLFPSILYRLKNQRKLIKKEMNKHGDFIEEADKKHYILKLKRDVLSEDDPQYKQLTTQMEAIYDDDYADASFSFKYLNTKQLALKVLMNTFYGEAGNAISPLYLLQLSGGITAAGRDNLKRVIGCLQQLDCAVIYGDTDSAYMQCPEATYLELDKEYYGGKITKLQYWTRMVEITFPEVARINQKVNDMLFEDNGTHFLSTAYEEVLWPVAFLAKKKYFGIPHEKEVNFAPKKLFIRGLDMKKRGVPPILIESCESILWKSVSLDELRPLRHLVEDEIDHVYKTEWPVSAFIKTGSYKPRKDNKAVHRFVARMYDERGIVIKPVERFKFVSCLKEPYYWDSRGRKCEVKAGDKMELAEIAEREKLPIDLDQYMSGDLLGQFARLLAYHAEFQVSRKGHVPGDDDFEKDVFENAKKYVQSICDSYKRKCSNVGVVYKKVFAQTEKKFKHALSNYQGGAVVNTVKFEPCMELNEIVAEIYKYIEKNIGKRANLVASALVKQLMKEVDVVALRRKLSLFDTLHRTYGQDLSQTKSELELLIRSNTKLFQMRNTLMNDIINDIRTKYITIDAYDLPDTYYEGLYNEEVEAYLELRCNDATDTFDDYGDLMAEMAEICDKIKSIMSLQLEVMHCKYIIENKFNSSSKMTPKELDVKNVVNRGVEELDNLDDVPVY